MYYSDTITIDVNNDRNDPESRHTVSGEERTGVVVCRLKEDRVTEEEKSMQAIRE